MFPCYLVSMTNYSVIAYNDENKNAGCHTTGSAQGSTSPVVRSMARTQHFDKFLTFRLILLGSSGICLGGLWSSLGTSFLNILNCFCGWSSKCLGRSRGDPRSPLGPLQRYFGVIQMPLFKHVFYLPIVYCLLCCTLNH